MKVEIIAASVLICKGGPDIVNLETKLPSPFPEGVSNNTLFLRFEALKGSGVKYVMDNFGFQPNVIKQ
jgi:hypothetical protein